MTTNKSRSNLHEAVVKENSTEVETEGDTEEEEIETMDSEEVTEDPEETLVTDQRDVSTVVNKATSPRTVLNVIDSII